ncbi:MAG: DoxX family protein [Bryobacteraceae bacterium]
MTIWISRFLSGAPSLLFLFSAIMKFVQPPGLAQGFEHMQLNLSLAIPLGVLELTCLAIYLIPRTAVLGAILLTGYLGGAILTHLRVGDQFITHILLGASLWGGLYLRDPRLQALIPVVTANQTGRDS